LFLAGLRGGLDLAKLGNGTNKGKRLVPSYLQCFALSFGRLAAAHR
jgi:hypothetical protein